MANFPGGSGATPMAVAETVTNTKGASVPGGQRLAAIIGEGARTERLVSSAVGSGNDGLNETFTSTTGSDGRHFQLTYAPIISNRTVLKKNGIPLSGIEAAVVIQDGYEVTDIPSKMDYVIEISTGRIVLKSASLVDQGGSTYSASSLNTGNGQINGLTLADTNAPTETWTVRCVSVRRDGNGDPVDGYAKFIAQGSVSGIVLDGYGNQVTWQSDGASVSNGILTFSVEEGVTSFVEGDKFTIKVKSGALSRGDSLTATYIAEIDLNYPEFFTDMAALTAKHGAPSLTNRLSLGAQLAFANGCPGVWAVQAAPSVPRRVSYVLQESASGNSASDDLTFILPDGVEPDTDSNVHFFVTDAATGVESQIIPNRVSFYDPTITDNQALFTAGDYVYSYTVVLEPDYDTVAFREDGVVTVVTGTTATLSSEKYEFGIDDVNRSVKIHTPAASAGTYEITSVRDGVATISSPGGFTTEDPVDFEVFDTDGSTAKILFSSDLALGAGDGLRCTVVDKKDAAFFDVNWTSAYESLEVIECDIVVPLPSQTISSIFTAGAIHCQVMSQVKNRKERMLFIGAIQGLTPDNVTGVRNAAVEDIGVLEGIQGDSVAELLAGDTEDLTNYTVQSAYGSTFRVVYFYPDEIVVQAGSDRVKVDGFFIAAAAAGYLTGQLNIALPLTNKVLSGFSILRDKLYKQIIIERIADAGITLLQPVAGGGEVIWGKTTTTSGFPEEEEISVVFIRDRIAKTMRSAFKGYIGTVEDATTPGSLYNKADNMMQSFKAQKLITAYNGLTVSRDKVDPRQWNISANVQPVYAINWIYIRVGLGVL